MFVPDATEDTKNGKRSEGPTAERGQNDGPVPTNTVRSVSDPIASIPWRNDPRMELTAVHHALHKTSEWTVGASSCTLMVGHTYGGMGVDREAYTLFVWWYPRRSQPQAPPPNLTANLARSV
jgi:hypothetical protein